MSRNHIEGFLNRPLKPEEIAERKRLIASAGDLYDACLAALDWFELHAGRMPGGFDVPPMDQLRAALKKADQG